MVVAAVWRSEWKRTLQRAQETLTELTQNLCGAGTFETALPIGIAAAHLTQRAAPTTVLRSTQVR